MNIDNELKKSGIEVISELDSESIQEVSKYVANGICKKFPNLHFNYDELFQEISNIPMYIAKISNSISDANYFYKNSSIYFRDGLGLNLLKKYAIHEIIHHLQEIKDEKNNLLKLGLCSLKNGKPIGGALNEAAVQIVSSYISDEKPQRVNYYGINFLAISPNLYPLICNLLSQMCYIAGEDALYDSVFNSNDTFKEKFISLTSKHSYNVILKNFDFLLDTEEIIFNLNEQFEKENNPQKKKVKYQKIVNSYINNIKKIFFETQKIIFTSYFDNQFLKLQSDSDINIYKTRFSIYNELIGVTDSYSNFSNYYKKKMRDLDKKTSDILNRKLPTTKRKNKFIIFLQKLLISLKIRTLDFLHV